VKKRKSLLHGLKPDQIRMLLWWADEWEARYNGIKNQRNYSVSAIAKREGFHRDEVSRVILGYKQLRVEKEILRIIEKWRWAVNQGNLKKQWEQHKKQHRKGCA